MKTVGQHADDFRKPLHVGYEYAVAVGKIDVAVNFPEPGATDADVLANVKNILAALDQALADKDEAQS